MDDKLVKSTDSLTHKPEPGDKDCTNTRNGSTKSKKTVQYHDPLEHMIRFCGQKIPRSPRRHLSDLMHIEHYENGGGYALHSYVEELIYLSRDELDLFARKYLKTLFTERRKRGISIPFSYYCIGVVHGAAEKFPELLSFMSKTYPNLKVSSNPLEHKNAVETSLLSEYVRNVQKTYTNGIYRFGPLHSLSLVGVKGEEHGCYCRELIEMIEEDPFLRLVTPWGEMSKLKGSNPKESNDGPILWCRPGEQTIPLFSTLCKNKRSLMRGCGLTDLLIGRRAMKGRQVSIHDRTPCHADHADDGFFRHTTAAIGLLKAIYPSNDPRSNGKIKSDEMNGTSANLATPTTSEANVYATARHSAYANPGRIVKDVVVFDPRHYPDLIERLKLDIMEPPASQCGTFWADDGELNQLHSEGFRYVRLPLRDNDIYFIPRNVVHQFKSVSAVTSVAWHARLTTYYQEDPVVTTAAGMPTTTTPGLNSNTTTNTDHVSANATSNSTIVESDQCQPPSKQSPPSATTKHESPITSLNAPCSVDYHDPHGCTDDSQIAPECQPKKLKISTDL